MGAIIDGIQAIADGISKFFDFIFSLIDFVISLISGLFQLLSMIPDALANTTSAIGYLPPFIAVGIIATLSIFLIKLIVGR